MAHSTRSESRNVMLDSLLNATLFPATARILAVDFSVWTNFPTATFLGMPVFVAPDGAGDLAVWKGDPDDLYPRVLFYRHTWEPETWEELMKLF